MQPFNPSMRGGDVPLSPDDELDEFNRRMQQLESSGYFEQGMHGGESTGHPTNPFQAQPIHTTFASSIPTPSQTAPPSSPLPTNALTPTHYSQQGHVPSPAGPSFSQPSSGLNVSPSSMGAPTPQHGATLMPGVSPMMSGIPNGDDVRKPVMIMDIDEKTGRPAVLMAQMTKTEYEEYNKKMNELGKQMKDAREQLKQSRKRILEPQGKWTPVMEALYDMEDWDVLNNEDPIRFAHDPLVLVSYAHRKGYCKEDHGGMKQCPIDEVIAVQKVRNHPNSTNQSNHSLSLLTISSSVDHPTVASS